MRRFAANKDMMRLRKKPKYSPPQNEEGRRGGEKTKSGKLKVHNQDQPAQRYEVDRPLG